MAITSKPIGARGRKQAQNLGIDPSRVPPGQYLTEKFPVLTVGRNQKFDLDDWDLRVDGEVEAPLSLTWDQLHALSQAEVTVDIHCVTRWSKLDTEWRGVRVRDLLERAAPTPSGTHLRRLEVMSGDRMGFWELNGYHNDADPWREQRHWF
jgi:DMSO/TMAO reductase YedYZ molybdopterin-dependent catalytic subunit